LETSENSKGVDGAGDIVAMTRKEKLEAKVIWCHYDTNKK
jgi:hypothetical protein